MGRKNHAKMPKVALIGLESSGKTVLLAALAKRFNQARDDKIYLSPLDNDTERYVSEVWDGLEAGHWPAPARPGEMFNLRWRIKGPHGVDGELRVADVAGRELRELFNMRSPEAVENMPKGMRALARYCFEADIVVVLINIGDFVGEVDAGMRRENQLALKSALDLLGKDNGRQVAIVFTRMDEYDALIEEHTAGFYDFLRKNISYIYGDHIHSKTDTPMRVAAVADTRTELDEAGIPRRVPAPDFTSSGLDKLMEWLGHAIKYSRENDRVAATPPAEDIDAPQNDPRSILGRFWGKISKPSDDVKTVAQPPESSTPPKGGGKDGKGKPEPDPGNRNDGCACIGCALVVISIVVAVLIAFA